MVGIVVVLVTVAGICLLVMPWHGDDLRQDAILIETNPKGDLGVFFVTNASRFCVEYWPTAQIKVSNAWMNVVAGAVLRYEDRRTLASHNSVRITVAPPPTTTEWRVALWCVKAASSDHSVSAKLRSGLRDWNLDTLADWVPTSNRGVLINGPEMKK